MPKYGMKFDFTGFVIAGRELKSKTSDWKATIFKFNAMTEIIEVLVSDETMIENLKKVGDRAAHVTGVIERQGEKVILVPMAVEALKS